MHTGPIKIRDAPSGADISYSTTAAAPDKRKLVWSEAISRIYFPLDLSFRANPAFSGRIDVWSLGTVSISRNVSDGLIYARQKRHLLKEREESYLITVPELSDIRFVQDGRDVRCGPGGFLIERSHLPYQFSHSEPNALWVLKVPVATLRARVSRPERLATLTFDATRGAGALFVDTLRLAVARIAEMDGVARTVMGKHLVDLLALAVEGDDRVLGGSASSVQSAHLRQIEQYIRANLSNPLTPRTIAQNSRISVRTLHHLFETQGTTVSRWLRQQRLLMCDEALRDPYDRKSVSEIAFQWGFNDQAQFSRQYRGQFGQTPSDTRAASRGKR